MPRRSRNSPVSAIGQPKPVIEHEADEDGILTPTVRLNHSRVILATYDPSEVEDDGERQAILVCFDTDEATYKDSFEDRCAREIETRLAEHFGAIVHRCYWDHGYIHLSFHDGNEREHLLKVAHFVQVIECGYGLLLKAESQDRCREFVATFRKLKPSEQERVLAEIVENDGRSA